MRLDRYVLAGLIALAAPAGLAQERGPGQEQAQRPPLPAPVTTRHELALPDRRLAYDATVEAYTLSDDAGKPLAEVSTISYRLADASAERPVTFFFNGGPGAASAFLNLGGLGPKVLATTEDGRPQGADGRLIDNPHSWLAWSDLVFVDPVGTGLSRPLGEDGKGFWSVEGDIRAAGAALRLWLTRQGRWPSPKYLVGESYGGFRAAKLAAHLYDEHGIGLAGLVLVSPVVDFATIARGDGTLLLPDALRLPSIAAVARRHGKGAENDDLEAVERFALGEYLTALAAPEPPDAVLARLARLTGLPEDSVRERRGRLSAGLVADELLEAEALAVSAYDGAVAGPAAPRRGSRVDPGFDPAVQAVAAAFNGLLRGPLATRTERPYRVLSEQVFRAWDYQAENRFADATEDLARALEANAAMRLLIVHGLYDLVTPYFASEWLVGQMRLPEAARARIALRNHPGGHMLYLRPDGRAAMAADAAELYGPGR